MAKKNLAFRIDHSEAILSRAIATYTLDELSMIGRMMRDALPHIAGDPLRTEAIQNALTRVRLRYAELQKKQPKTWADECVSTMKFHPANYKV